MIYYKDYVLNKRIISLQQIKHGKQTDITDQTIYCFDIETSSGFLNNKGEVIAFDRNNGKKFYQNKVKVSLCYIWQFSIDDTVIYGRTLEEFKEFYEQLKLLHQDIKFTVWVHNLAYEFGFLYNIIAPDPTDIFSRDAHKVMKFTDGIAEWRCSYFLTRLSLDAWGKQVGKVFKAVGKLDYNVIRTPFTKLNPDELEYCEKDCLVMYHGLVDYRKKYGNLENIPLTQTGEVRKVVKEMYQHGNLGYLQLMTKLLPQNEYMYNFMKDCFAGGYTHSNWTRTGQIYKNVHSFDITSSYPAKMCFEKYPMTPFIKANPDNFELYYKNRENVACMFEITFYNIKSTKFNHYISKSKAKNKLHHKTLIDNGRIIECPEITLRLTEIDYEIISQCYTWERKEVKELYTSSKKPLDKKYIKYVLDLFKKKTEYKDVDGMEDIYMFSKQQLNSLFGMMVTDICNTEAFFDGKEWKVTQPDVDKTIADLNHKIYKNFLAYQNGIWITAYARKALWDMILKIDADVIYCDTDSVKFIGDYDYLFEDYNKQILKQGKETMKKLGLQEDYFMPISPKGKVCILGTYDREHDYDEFVTLGAKRYAFKIDGKIGITVSGVNKKAASQLTSLEEFTPQLEFDEEHCGKTIMTYLVNMPECVWNKGQPDEFRANYRYGIHAQETTYKMTLDKDYYKLIMNNLNNRKK